jgi:hypothetical protein
MAQDLGLLARHYFDTAGHEPALDKAQRTRLAGLTHVLFAVLDPVTGWCEFHAAHERVLARVVL